MSENSIMKTYQHDIESISEFVGRGIGPSYTENDSQIFAINQKCIRNGKVTLNFARFHDSSAPIQHNRILRKNDICVNSTGTGTIGRVALYSQEKGITAFADSHVTIVRVKPDLVDARYLVEFMSANKFQRELENRAFTGSTNQIELNKSELEKLVVELPSIIQQQKIAKVLSTIDNQIEQTQTLIDKYTAIKQGLMADLFSRGIDIKTGELRPSYEQAPELYWESELGWIPKEWSVKRLDEVSEIGRGKFTHRPRDDKRCYDGEHPFIQTGDIAKVCGGYLSNHKQTLSDFGRSVSKEFPADTIAVTIAANIADTAILRSAMCFPDSIVGVNVNLDIANLRFIEMSIRNNKLKLEALAPQSAQKNINLEDLKPLAIPYPKIPEQKAIASKYEQVFEVIRINLSQVEKLKVQKQGLMQDLLTGKISVDKLPDSILDSNAA